MCRWRAVAQGWKSSIRSSSRGRGSWRTTGATGPLGAGAMFSGGTTVRARACCGGQIGASCSVYDEVDGVRLTDLPPPEVEDPGNTQWNRVPCRIRLEPVRSTPHWEDARPELAGPGLGENTWEAYNAARQVFAPAPQVESRPGGWPDWSQGPEWPSCPGCGRRMRLIWQLDSEPDTGLMWGDVGRVYIFACPTPCSPQSLALVIQCG